MSIIRMIIHNVHKEQFSKEVSLQTRDSLLPINDRTEEFLSQAERSYNRSTSKKYGTFLKDTENYRFQTRLRGYLNDQSDATFIEFSQNTAISLRAALERITQSTGGYLVMVHSTGRGGVPCFFVLSLTDRAGIAINPQTLDLQDNFILDIEHLDMGARVLIDKWEAEEDTGPYLSFLSRRKRVSDYFADFIGCGKWLSNRDATRNLFKLVSAYAEENKDRITVDGALASVYENVTRSGIASLNTIANVLSPNDPDSFHEFVQHSDIPIHQEFKAPRSELQRFVYRKYDGEDLKLSVKNKLIEDGRVQYQQARKRVIIKDENGAIGRELFGYDEQEPV